jgi:Na+-driven multidrug efflux pump
MLGAPLGVAVWSLLGFFNGIGRPTITLRITAIIAVLNVLLNQLMVVDLRLGVAGSAWATGICALGLMLLLRWRSGAWRRIALSAH